MGSAGPQSRERRARARFAAALALLVLGAPAARAELLIDDFETAPFLVQNVDEGVTVLTQTDLDPAHVLAGRRAIRVYSPYAGSTATATLAVSDVTDDGPQLDAVGDAYVSFNYSFAEPVDLLAAGVDMIEIVGLESTAPGRVRVGVQWGGGGQSAIIKPLDADGVQHYRFSEFPDAPDFSQVDTILIQMILDETGSVRLSGARVVVPEPAAGLAGAAAALALGALARRRSR